MSDDSDDDAACIEHYQQHCQDGTLYEFIHRHLDEFQTLAFEEVKDKIKGKVLCDVFAKRKANKRGDEYPSNVEDVFARLWPPIYRFIRATNNDGWEHANLIRELQRAESSLVIGQVCEGLRVRYPRMFIVSLHDALYSTEDHMQAITGEFERAFEQNGYRMSLSPG